MRKWYAIRDSVRDSAHSHPLTTRTRKTCRGEVMRVWTASEKETVPSSLYYVIAWRSMLEQLALQCVRRCGWIQLARSSTDTQSLGISEF